MPNVEKTPRQTLRIEVELWEEFGRRTGFRERARVMREFIAWYCRVPGARLPKRPPVS